MLLLLLLLMEGMGGNGTTDPSMDLRTIMDCRMKKNKNKSNLSRLNLPPFQHILSASDEFLVIVVNHTLCKQLLDLLLD